MTGKLELKITSFSVIAVLLLATDSGEEKNHQKTQLHSYLEQSTNNLSMLEQHHREVFQLESD